ncbi:MAG TPA: transposase [Micromonosporaceae bacterium]
MPPSIAEWLPVEHPVWFVIEVINDLAPELKGFHARPVLGGTGRAAYDPMMLTTLLVYAMWQGVRSSRQIEARCHTDVAFRIVCAQDPPDHSTIARFRKANAARFADLFAQVLLLCARSGMVRFGKVAIDGTKVAGNASSEANVTLSRVRALAQAEVDAGLAADADEDANDDASPPSMLRDPTKRRERLKRVREELEAEQALQERADVQRQARAEQHLAEVVADTNRKGRAPAGSDAVTVARARLGRERARQQKKIDDYEAERAKPLQERSRAYLGSPPSSVDRAPRVRRAMQALARAERAAQTAGHEPSAQGERAVKQAKRNLTDCDSRLMPTRKGWIQGYNVQAAVTEDHVVVAVSVGNNPSDTGQAIPMMNATQAAADALAEHAGTDTTIGDTLMDAGYDSVENAQAPGPPRLIANSKRRHQERAAKTKPTTGPPPADATARQAMDHRLRTPEGIATYRRRGAIVEPIFGHIKDTLGLRRFLTRGLTNVTAEAHLAFATLNLRRLHTHIARTAGAW